ncbi:MAG: cellulase family glycosylhydrolase [Muribaculaceae bacterium]|nr:cellulase family glycosylhydrolase [Muribaculaceae bacterium]
MNKLYIILTVAVLAAMVSCSDNDKETPVGNPYSAFCEVNSEDSPVSVLNFDNYEGYRMVDIRSNVSWQLSETPDWITISNHSGPATEKEPIHLKITVDENKTSNERSADLVLTGAQGVKSTLRIVQSAFISDGWQTALEACNAMKVGLNLFNTLDANGTWFDQDDVHAFETCWGQPVADQEWFTAVKAAGFNAVRIPVTWFPHMDSEWKVKKAWMDRVEEVVNYALNENLYVVLNVHHDTGDHGDAWVCADWQNIDSVLEKFNALWKQIAERFNKYDEHLIFEAYNELLDQNHRWNSPTSNDGYLATNALAQGFVNTVRETGGNNEHRNLVVSLYSAHGSQEGFDSFVMPKDKYLNHLFVEVHNYSPMGFTNILNSEAAPTTWTKQYEDELKAELDIIGQFTKKYHIPVIIGESGTNGKNDDAEDGKYAEFLSTYSRQTGDICVLYWCGVIDRTTYKTNCPAVMEGLLKGNEY